MGDLGIEIAPIEGLDGGAQVTLLGALDEEALPPLAARIRGAQSEGLRRFIVDLGGVGVATTEGLASLLKLAVGILETRGEVVLADIRPDVRPAVARSGLEGIFKVFDTVGEAADDLRSRPIPEGTETKSRSAAAGGGGGTDDPDLGGGSWLEQQMGSEVKPAAGGGKAKGRDTSVLGKMMREELEAMARGEEGGEAEAPAPAAEGGLLGGLFERETKEMGGEAAAEAAPTEEGAPAPGPSADVSMKEALAGLVAEAGGPAETPAPGEEGGEAATGAEGEPAPMAEEGAEAGEPQEAEAEYAAPSRGGGGGIAKLAIAAVVVVAAAGGVGYWYTTQGGEGAPPATAKAPAPPATAATPKAPVTSAPPPVTAKAPPSPATAGTAKTATPPPPPPPPRTAAPPSTAAPGGKAPPPSGKAPGDAAAAAAAAAQARERAQKLETARAALESGRGSDAREGAEDVLKADPANRDARAVAAASEAYRASEAASAAGDWATAAREARRGLDALPGLAVGEALVSRTGEPLRKAATDRLAARDLPAAEALLPGLDAAPPGDAATRASAEAIRQRRREYDALVAEAETRAAAGKGDDAAAALEAAAGISAKPDLSARIREVRVAGLRAEAVAKALSGEGAAALEILRRALEISPGDVGLAEEAARLRGTLVRERVGLAREAVARGSAEEATLRVREALEIAPEHEPARRLADTLGALGPATSLPAGFAVVPGGDYPVGSPDESGNPPRTARLAACLVSVREVTNADFAKFVAAGGYRSDRWWPAEAKGERTGFVDATGRPGPAGWRDGSFASGADERPVTGISWCEAAAYAKWAGARLPSEEEWEVAASWDPETSRGRAYPWGDSWEPARAGLDGAPPALVPVGMRDGDQSPLGARDMAGNAMEWTSGAWAESGDHRAVRGGGPWVLAPEADCRPSRRRFHAGPLRARLPFVGFRLARDLVPAETPKPPEKPPAKPRGR
ncbi:MAG: SUMF1/EgtB/PvdO family nonheme iron enzyme [Planctomycetales bacterium]|nr:SUMF1/EgtB/PvdO family nonheme iron enzyme [Planctomycetales bacterium]